VGSHLWECSPILHKADVSERRMMILYLLSSGFVSITRKESKMEQVELGEQALARVVGGSQESSGIKAATLLMKGRKTAPVAKSMAGNTQNANFRQNMGEMVADIGGTFAANRLIPRSDVQKNPKK
jgi:hypothetical protein